MARRKAVQDVLDSIEGAIRCGTRPGDPSSRAADRIFGALRMHVEPIECVPQLQPACTHLDAALAHADAGPPAAARLSAALRELAPLFSWYHRHGHIEEPFASGHANVTLVGPGGLEASDRAWIGVSLMAPNVIYPDHSHPPEEVYVVLSPGEWRRESGAWVAPGIGGIHYNEPGIVHAMRSGSQPLLATWSLWREPT